MSSVLLRTTLALGVSALAAPAFAAGDFAACFTLTPGVSWSNGSETLSTSEATVAGEPALAVTTSGGGVSSATVHDRSGRQLLAQNISALQWRQPADERRDQLHRQRVRPEPRP